MRRNKMLATALAAAIAITGLAAQASSAKSLQAQVTTLHHQMANAFGKIGALQSVDAGVQNGIQTLSGQIKSLGSQISSINAQLAVGATALTQIQSALENSTTGLVGLNNARPLIGFVVSNAAVSGSEFTVTRVSAGTYILSFVNGAGTATDVSKRSVMVQPLPTGGIPIDASSVNCSATGTPCGASDTKGTDELVVTQSAQTFAATDANFQVAAISG